MLFREKPSWREGKMLIWPERVQIYEDGSRNKINWFQGTVVDPIYNGQGQELLLIRDSDGSQPNTAMSVKARTAKNYHSGQRVGVYFPPEDIVPLDNSAHA
jgi:hypothetical protein